MRWESDIQIFSKDECQGLADEFFAYPDKRDENFMPEFYKNSFGVYNLPGSLNHVDRLTKQFEIKYPGIVFANSYARVYYRHSVLSLHTDRKNLDLSLSVCVEDKNNLDWPLNISAKCYYKDSWDLGEDHGPYKEKFIAAHFGVGYGALVEGRRFPHWRDELLCGEAQRALYIFYHWTFPKPSWHNKIIIESKSQIDLMVVQNFLTDKECDELIQQSEATLKKSMVVDWKTGNDVESVSRKSAQTFLSKQSNEVIIKIENDISELLEIPVGCGEDLQIVRYEVGGEYKAHHDFFSCDEIKKKDRFINSGQRVATVIMYLNTPESGGETEFPLLGLKIKAVRGNALVFRYPNQEAASLHAGRPVTSGVKWIATKWIRERDFV